MPTYTYKRKKRYTTLQKVVRWLNSHIKRNKKKGKKL